MSGIEVVEFVTIRSTEFNIRQSLTKDLVGPALDALAG
jgi:hypothetical protein